MSLQDLFARRANLDRRPTSLRRIPNSDEKLDATLVAIRGAAQCRTFTTLHSTRHRRTSVTPEVVASYLLPEASAMRQEIKGRDSPVVPSLPGSGRALASERIFSARDRRYSRNFCTSRQIKASARKIDVAHGTASNRFVIRIPCTLNGGANETEGRSATNLTSNIRHCRTSVAIMRS
jgi:hypothetical protein